MQVFQRNLSSDQQGLPHDECLDEYVQSALYSGSTPSAGQKTLARANLLRLARQQPQLPAYEYQPVIVSTPTLILAIGFVRRHVLGFLRSCFVNDAPYNRASGTSVWVRRRTSSELAYLEFAPMAY